MQPASEQQQGAYSRHCAYCLKGLPADSVYLCSACHRRAYCSRPCQKKDWPVHRGPGHKYWSKLGCGEEDLDWSVQHISAAKGLGIMAKRELPRGFRIMVDAGNPWVC